MWKRREKEKFEDYRRGKGEVEGMKREENVWSREGRQGEVEGEIKCKERGVRKRDETLRGRKYKGRREGKKEGREKREGVTEGREGRQKRGHSRGFFREGGWENKSNERNGKGERKMGSNGTEVRRLRKV